MNFDPSIISNIITAVCAGAVSGFIGFLWGLGKAVTDEAVPWPKVFPIHESMPREITPDEAEMLATAFELTDTPELLYAFLNAGVRLARAKDEHREMIASKPVPMPAHSEPVGSGEGLASISQRMMRDREQWERNPLEPSERVVLDSDESGLVTANGLRQAIGHYSKQDFYLPPTPVGR